MREEIRKTYYAMKDLRDISPDHQEIVDAIKSGDIEKAVKRHSSHFLRIRGLMAPGSLPRA
ncbi:MAG: hypothetical protein LBS57_06970 [Treponema sp.]|nr:hypothetical protein [Treponema sp.]